MREMFVPTGESSAAGEGSSMELPAFELAKPAVTEISLSNFDKRTIWDDSAVILTLCGDSILASSQEGVEIAGSVVTIQTGGTYVLSGNLTDGRVIVNLKEKTDKVQLVMNGASIKSSTSAPLTVLQADKVSITLADGTENALADAANYTVFDVPAASEEDTAFPSACLASKDDLTINGGGSLIVTGNYNNGIHCKNDMKLVSGTVQVTAKNHGVRGNDSVQIAGGTLEITSGGDGVKTSTADNEKKGCIVMTDGTVKITAAQDGVDAAQSLSVSGGTLDVTAGGGSANGESHAGENFGGFGGGGGGHKFTDGARTATSTANTTAETVSDSKKGIKAASVLAVTGGTVTINAADDAVHSNADITLSGSAVLTLASGDDGIHGDKTVTIAENATVTVSESYEGIEAAVITIAGGNVHVKSTDDGLNASDGSGGNMGFNRNGSGDLYLRGGYVYVDAGGDGLDSNGDITMTDGTVIVCGPTDNGNGALDCGDNQNKIRVSGGTLMAVGSTGMMEAPESAYIGSASLGAAADTLIVVTDSEGSVLGALKTPKQAQGIVFSANGMTDGYQVYKGGSYEGTFNADNWATGGSYSGGTLVTSVSSSIEGGFGGGHGGMKGDRPQSQDGDNSRFEGGGKPQRPVSGGDVPQMPSNS